LRPQRALLFYAIGLLIVVASGLLALHFPSKIFEIACGMIAGQIALWSIPLAIILRKRAADRQAEHFRALLRATSKIPARVDVGVIDLTFDPARRVWG